ncbi:MULTISPECIES: hypothetical protein [Nostocales]|uniref:Uncharacterized protein n=3 Tax=Nostocales TaxID=1161 RepID=A0A0C1QRY2_9CYAN|nr:hypothetical protein [Tolypothrix bouteillei]KAF3885843.1 hypothetical protein DA73_0400010450 [Tolypothrix bouteillei VB521301]
MHSVTRRYHVSEDGILHLDVPIGLTNAELEVTVTFQAIALSNLENNTQGKGWPPNFFEETFGACKDEPIVIDGDGIFDDNEELT